MTEAEQPSQTAWEDRCTDCDDTGVTIQTERRCACQPPVQAEQPSQWAVDTRFKDTFAHFTDLMDDEALARCRDNVRANDGHDMATLNHNSLRRIIARLDRAEEAQRAFAEREAELVGALAEIIRKFDAAPDAVRNVPLGIMRARAALKSREAGHG